MDDEEGVTGFYRQACDRGELAEARDDDVAQLAVGAAEAIDARSLRLARGAELFRELDNLAHEPNPGTIIDQVKSAAPSHKASGCVSLLQIPRFDSGEHQ